MNIEEFDFEKLKDFIICLSLLIIHFHFQCFSKRRSVGRIELYQLNFISEMLHGII